MFERAPGCYWLADEGRSTKEDRHHWTVASLSVQISPWYLILRRGRWSRVRDGFETVMTSRLGGPDVEWICVWHDARGWQGQIVHWYWEGVSWEDPSLDGKIGKWRDSSIEVAILEWGLLRGCDSQLCRYRWELEPKYTNCHVRASSAMPVRLGPISRGWVGSICEICCILDRGCDALQSPGRTWVACFGCGWTGYRRSEAGKIVWKTGCENVEWCPIGVEDRHTLPKLTSA